MHIPMIFIEYHLSANYLLQTFKLPDSELYLQGARHFVSTHIPEHYLILMPSNPEFDWLHNTTEINLYISTEPLADAGFPHPLLWIQGRTDGHLFCIEDAWNDIADLFDRFRQWDAALQSISRGGTHFQALIDACDRIVAEPISLIDNHLNYVAYSQQLSKERGYVRQFVDENNALPIDVATQLLNNPRYHESEMQTGTFDFMDDYHFIARNIFHHEHYVGRLICICTENPTLDRYQKELLIHLGPYVDIMYERNGSFFVRQPVVPLLHKLLYDCLDGGEGRSEDWTPLLEQYEWHLSDPYALIRLIPTYRHDKQMYADYLCPQIEKQWHFALAVFYDQSIIILFNARLAPDSFGHDMAYFLRNNMLSAGISQHFKDFQDLSFAYKQTLYALEYGAIKNPHYWYHYFGDLISDYVTGRLTIDIPAKFLCHPALKLLLEHDRNEGTEYYQTLFTLIKNHYNTTAAANELYIHRTTFIKRMEHIREISRLNLEDWPTQFHLILSFHLLTKKVLDGDK